MGNDGERVSQALLKSDFFAPNHIYLKTVLIVGFTKALNKPSIPQSGCLNNYPLLQETIRALTLTLKPVNLKAHEKGAVYVINLGL